jgi:predicted unusual protein kinase regulating ubiquinone biosynthesis (AarF/ABC1/UbiB family)
VALIKTGQALSLRPDILKNDIWAEELGKLSDAVGSFSDKLALQILCSELKDIAPKIEERQKSLGLVRQKSIGQTSNSIILDLFEFYNDKSAVASASIGQVYKAKVRRGSLLEAAIGKDEANYWGGKTVAIKVQRPDAARSASLDMYLLRRAAEWLSLWRGGDLTSIADQVSVFGVLKNITHSEVTHLYTMYIVLINSLVKITLYFSL